MITPGHCVFARAFIDWCVRHRLLKYREANQLVASVVAWELRIRSCLSKQAFDTFTSANRIAEKHRNDPHKHYQAYQCRVCGKFHIGSSSQFRVGERVKRLNYRKRKERAYA